MKKNLQIKNHTHKSLTNELINKHLNKGMKIKRGNKQTLKQRNGKAQKHEKKIYTRMK